MHDEDGAGFFNRSRQDFSSEGHRMARRSIQIGNGEIQMNLLRQSVRPARAPIAGSCLECEFEWGAVGVHLAPAVIINVQPTK
jgi:hypothetical protein